MKEKNKDTYHAPVTVDWKNHLLVRNGRTVSHFNVDDVVKIKGDRRDLEGITVLGSGNVIILRKPKNNKSRYS